MNDPVLFWRDRISEVWHQESAFWMRHSSYSFATDDQYIAFCAAKDWIQDTSEALSAHMRTDFSSDPIKAYLEFWGILQALFVQQDAICEMIYSFTGSRQLMPEPIKGSGWQELRDLRNLSVGHPTAKGASKTGIPTARCVTGRTKKTYRNITLSIYRNGSTDHPAINLKEIIQKYQIEAEPFLRYCFCRLLSQVVSK